MVEGEGGREREGGAEAGAGGSTYTVLKTVKLGLITGIKISLT